ncbi:hypothetical protein M3Y98_00384200 [Aphelenchoides besseyi]|nr:hypothetical protein M3Y98_00384200 [Aphelenchoides besseyi]
MLRIDLTVLHGVLMADSRLQLSSHWMNKTLDFIDVQFVDFRELDANRIHTSLRQSEKRCSPQPQRPTENTCPTQPVQRHQLPLVLTQTTENVPKKQPLKPKQNMWKRTMTKTMAPTFSECQTGNKTASMSYRKLLKAIDKPIEMDEPKAAERAHDLKLDVSPAKIEHMRFISSLGPQGITNMDLTTVEMFEASTPDDRPRPVKQTGKKSTMLGLDKTRESKTIDNTKKTEFGT